MVALQTTDRQRLHNVQLPGIALITIFSLLSVAVLIILITLFCVIRRALEAAHDAPFDSSADTGTESLHPETHVA